MGETTTPLLSEIRFAQRHLPNANTKTLKLRAYPTASHEPEPWPTKNRTAWRGENRQIRRELTKKATTGTTSTRRDQKPQNPLKPTNHRREMDNRRTTRPRSPKVTTEIDVVLKQSEPIEQQRPHKGGSTTTRRISNQNHHRRPDRDGGQPRRRREPRRGRRTRTREANALSGAWRACRRGWRRTKRLRFREKRERNDKNFREKRESSYLDVGFWYLRMIFFFFYLFTYIEMIMI